MKNVTLVKHPMVTDSMAYLRDIKTGVRDFRYHSNRICRILFQAAVEDLRFEEELIDTPVKKEVAVYKLAEEDVVVIPVYRAGLAMMQGAMKTLLESRFGFVGLERDEETAIAREYYWKLPETSDKSVLMVTDPMLATGGTLLHTLKKLNGLPNRQMRIVCVVAAPEGIEKIHSEYPDVSIFTAAIDEGLNDKAYIVPGLGDYGDRYFGTG